MARGDYEPTAKEVQGMPVEIQVAVLYERVGNLSGEVKALKRALWSFIASIIGGSVLFLFSLASGWIGPRGQGAHATLKSIWGLIS